MGRNPISRLMAWFGGLVFLDDSFVTSVRSIIQYFSDLLNIILITGFLGGLMLPIYVDLDDVISDTAELLITILNREFGKTVVVEDIFSFDLKVSFGLTDSEYDHFFQMVHRPEVIMAFAPIKGAIDVLEEWAQLGRLISIVTGRLTSTYESSLTWLDKHNVPYHSFMMVDKYSRENVDRSIAISLEDLSAMKFSFAVEDSASMARHLSQQMGLPVALMDRPWNRNADLDNKIGRYTSWNNIRDAFSNA